jgi:hypothetical protein
MGYVNIVRHPGWEQPASGVREPGRMPLSLVGLPDTIAPDLTQELRVSDDEIGLRPAAQRAQARETVFSLAPRPPHRRVRRAADPSQATEVAR